MFNKFRGQYKEGKRSGSNEEFVILSEEEEVVEPQLSEEDPLAKKFVKLEQDPVAVAKDDREAQLQKEEDEWFRQFRGDLAEETADDNNPPDEVIEDFPDQDSEKPSLSEDDVLEAIDDLPDKKIVELPEESLLDDIPVEEPAGSLEQSPEDDFPLEELVSEEPKDTLEEDDSFLDRLDERLDALEEGLDEPEADDFDAELTSVFDDPEEPKIPDDEAEFVEDLLSDLGYEEAPEESDKEDELWIQDLISDLENNIEEKPSEMSYSAEEEEERIRAELDALDEIDAETLDSEPENAVEIESLDGEEVPTISVIPVDVAALEEISDDEPLTEESQKETEPVDESSWYESTSLLHTAAVIVLDLTEEE